MMMMMMALSMPETHIRNPSPRGEHNPPGVPGMRSALSLEEHAERETGERQEHRAGAGVYRASTVAGADCAGRGS